MKANSASLEINVEISADEIVRLGKGERLETSLRFREVRSDEKTEIPFSLEYVRGKGEGQEIGVRQFPNDCYMGKARQIGIILYDYHYGLLVETGETGQRFWQSGRVDIKRK